MADFVDKKRAEMEKRLKELKPYVEEHDRLEAAIEALSGVARSASRSVSGATRRATRRPAGRKRTAGTGKRGRPKGSGKRGKQCADLVKKNPGITIPEIARKIGIKQNYLYRVMPALEKEGLVTKKGKGWYPTAKA
jgi:CRP-like cAMP-binding protein